MKRSALVLAALLVGPSIAVAAAIPSPDSVGGLRRAPSLGVALDTSSGRVTISAVGPGSAAERMGLRPQDVIESADQKAIGDAVSFRETLARKRAGDSLTLAARRGNDTVTVAGALAAPPLEQQADYDIEYGHVAIDGTKRRVIVTRPRIAESIPRCS